MRSLTLPGITPMKPLTPQEAADLSAWLLDNPEARLELIGWLLSSAQFSGKIASEIRAFKDPHNRRKNEN